MNIDKMVDELRQSQCFSERVGMMLIHKGVVREISQLSSEKIRFLDVNPDFKRMDALCREFETREGIFRVLAKARAGRLKPGDDMLLLLVAGDIRDHVNPVMSELLDRIESEAVRSQEVN